MASQTRPDLLYSTTQLSRRSNKCTLRDMAAADRLLRYIASTASLGITFCSHNQAFRIFAYVDSSYNCYSDSKSHSGVSLHLGQFSGAFYCNSHSLPKDSLDPESTIRTRLPLIYSYYSFPR